MLFIHSIDLSGFRHRFFAFASRASTYLTFASGAGLIVPKHWETTAIDTPTKNLSPVCLPSDNVPRTAPSRFRFGEPSDNLRAVDCLRATSQKTGGHDVTITEYVKKLKAKPRTILTTLTTCFSPSAIGPNRRLHQPSDPGEQQAADREGHENGVVGTQRRLRFGDQDRAGRRSQNGG